MEKGISQSIETRRRALYDHFNLPPDAKDKAEDLFDRMAQFGLQCNGQADFEKKLLSSPLTQEYNRLFVEFAPFVIKPDDVPTKEEYAKMVAKDTTKSVVKMQIEQTARSAVFRMLPPWLQQWWVRGVYNIPILGDILSARNNTRL